MTPEQALEILGKVAAKMNGDLEAHMTAQAALQILKTFVTEKSENKEKADQPEPPAAA